MKKKCDCHFQDLQITNGQASWFHNDQTKYVATGVDVDGKRFSTTFSSWPHVNGINLYRGSKWIEREKDKHSVCPNNVNHADHVKRKKIVSVWN